MTMARTTTKPRPSTFFQNTTTTKNTIVLNIPFHLTTIYLPCLISRNKKNAGFGRFHRPLPVSFFFPSNKEKNKKKKKSVFSTRERERGVFSLVLCSEVSAFLPLFRTLAARLFFAFFLALLFLPLALSRRACFILVTARERREEDCFSFRFFYHLGKTFFHDLFSRRK